MELAALSDPELVVQAVAAAVGVRGEAGRSLAETLVEALKPRRMLLVLDNCEHLLGACAAVAEALLRGCPEVRLLATSREGLNIPGETSYRLRSLSVPSPGPGVPTTESLTQYEAVRLFIDRATTAAPSFAITDQNAPAVAQVCQRLDGIPLAIELAAARVKALPVEEINARLGDRFRLLTGGSRTALPRQQTLRASIDWSYELLSETERVLLRRLSVFAGGWTLEAAEVVCGEHGLDRWEVLDGLTVLVEKSLVVYDEGERAARYRLLETVRQYARDRLMEAGEGDETRNRHLQYFLGLAEQSEIELRGPEQVAWHRRLETEHDNLRAALEWSRTEADGAEAGLRLAGALKAFWGAAGYWQEGMEWLRSFLGAAGPTMGTAARVKALQAAADLANNQQDTERALPLAEEALALARQLQDRTEVAVSLRILSSVATSQEDYERAARLAGESLALFRELDDKQGIVNALRALAGAESSQGTYSRLEALGEEALLEESLALCRELGDERGIGYCYEHLGLTARRRGDYTRALAFYREALAVDREVGSSEGITTSLREVAGIATAQGEMERAARLLGAEEALREAAVLEIWPAYRADYERTVAATRAALGEEAFAAAWAEGRAMTVEDVVTYAMAGTSEA